MFDHISSSYLYSKPFVFGQLVMHAWPGRYSLPGEAMCTARLQCTICRSSDVGTDVNKFCVRLRGSSFVSRQKKVLKN